MPESSDASPIQIGDKAQSIESEHGIKVRIDYFFFLVSFLAVIIFSMAPLLSDAIFELDLFAKATVPLVVGGAFFGYLGSAIEFDIKIKMGLHKKFVTIERAINLYVSDIIFLVVLLIELTFLWYYIYL